MDAPPDRPNYTGLKFQFSIVRHPQPTIKSRLYPDLNPTVSELDKKNTDF